MDNICYTENFLTSVIARVDLLNPIPELLTQVPATIAELIKKHFPIAEPRKMQTHQVQISPTGMDKKTKEFTEWDFHGINREKTLTIAQQGIWVNYRAYSTYEQLKEEFFGVLSAFFEKFSDAQGIRSGLRYIMRLRSRVLL